MTRAIRGHLVVIGGGLVGRVAATRATTNRRRVVVLEHGSDERYLCNSRLPDGVFHVGMTYTMGGIVIDAHGRAVDACGTPPAGLCTGGAAIVGLEGGDPAGYVCGLVKASVTGPRAAEHVLGLDL